MSDNEIQHQLLLDELNQIIQSGRNNILLSVNSTITLVYWQVGLRIQKEILNGDRAAYGKQVTQIMGKLHPGRLTLAQAEEVLKVLVHHIDHPVAKGPQEKEGADQQEHPQMTSPVQRPKKRMTKHDPKFTICL